MWSLKNQSQETCLSNGKKKKKKNKEGSVLLCDIILTWKSTVMVTGNYHSLKSLFVLRC